MKLIENRVNVLKDLGVSPFIAKLFAVLECEELSHIIHWIPGQ